MLTLEERADAIKAVRQLAQNELDPVVKDRAQEIAEMMRQADHSTLLAKAGQVARNTSALVANRLRALDVIERLIRT